MPCHGLGSENALEPTGVFSYDRVQPIMTKMIKNGLYSISTKLLDGVKGSQTGISVLRDGKMLGGGAFLYHVGSYRCSDGKWKGEVTSREHTPSVKVRPFADTSPQWDLPERIRMRALNSRPQRSSASEAFGCKQSFGC